MMRDAAILRLDGTDYLVTFFGDTAWLMFKEGEDGTDPHVVTVEPTPSCTCRASRGEHSEGRCLHIRGLRKWLKETGE
jgi:hypothetical protein